MTHFLRHVRGRDRSEERTTGPRKTVASQQRQSERIESVGRLAGGVAHDFNNMLTVVTGHTHRVLQHLPANDPLRDDIGAVLDAATRGAGDHASSC